MGWPTDSLGPHWTEMMERATPRERELFGFPAIGDPYWNDQTLTDVQCRYPRMDMTPLCGWRPRVRAFIASVPDSADDEAVSAPEQAADPGVAVSPRAGRGAATPASTRARVRAWRHT